MPRYRRRIKIKVVGLRLEGVLIWELMRCKWSVREQIDGNSRVEVMGSSFRSSYVQILEPFWRSTVWMSSEYVEHAWRKAANSSFSPCRNRVEVGSTIMLPRAHRMHPWDPRWSRNQTFQFHRASNYSVGFRAWWIDRHWPLDRSSRHSVRNPELVSHRHLHYRSVDWAWGRLRTVWYR